jgi:hypothetical protein
MRRAVAGARPARDAAAGAPASTSEQIPGQLAVLSTVPDPRKRRGRRFTLVFVLAVAAACVLAGAASFREIGDQAADLPQELVAVLGGIPHPLRRRIIVRSEKRFRTLIQALDAEHPDEIIGCWLRRMVGPGRLDHLLTALAIDGKWLRGVPEVKLFAAMLHEEKVVIAQHQIPAERIPSGKVAGAAGRRVVAERADRFRYQFRGRVKRQRFAEDLTGRRREAQLVLRHRHSGQQASTIVWIQVGGERVGAQLPDVGWPALPEPDDGERVLHIPRPRPDFLVAFGYVSEYPFDPGPGKVG